MISVSSGGAPDSAKSGVSDRPFSARTVCRLSPMVCNEYAALRRSGMVVRIAEHIEGTREIERLHVVIEQQPDGTCGPTFPNGHTTRSFSVSTKPPRGRMVISSDVTPFSSGNVSLLNPRKSMPSVMSVPCFVTPSAFRSIFTLRGCCRSALMPATYQVLPARRAITTYWPGNPSMNFTSSHTAGTYLRKLRT